jgi:hypothetical protein
MRNAVRDYYDGFGEREWERLTRQADGAMEEADRLGRAVPEIVRGTESLRELLEQAEQARLALIRKTADTLRAADWLIEKIQEAPGETKPPKPVVLAQMQELRRQAYDRMAEIIPDEVFLWTPEMQASLRESDADFAAGRAHGPFTDEEFVTFLQEQSAHV